MKYGLFDNQLKIVEKILCSYTEIEEAVLFGSRAIGTFKEASDVDIALKGKKASHKLAVDLKCHFEEKTNLPYFFDFISYPNISNKNLKKHIDKYGIVIYRKGWKKVKLGDLLEVKHGYAFKGENITSEPTNNILVTPGNFNIGGGFKSSKFKYFNNDVPKDYILKRGDLIVTMTDLSKDSDTLGYSAKVPTSKKGEVYLHNQRIGLIQLKTNEVDQDFIYWLMRTWDYHWFIVSSSSGTSIRHTSPERVKEYEFYLPPLPEQKAIAEVLSSLDDKIELLHKQNKTLENTAQTLFHKWFVEDAKDDWKEGFIPDEFNFTMGLSPPGNSYNEAKEGLPMFQGNADFGFRFPQNRIYTTNPKRVAEPFNTLISVRAPVGEQNMALEKCCIGRGVAGFSYKKNKDFYTYTYYKIHSLINEIKQFNSTGTVFGSINKTDFNDFPITIPSINVVQKFQNKVKPIDDKVILNCIQICKLENLCDTLLPKLMDRKIKIKCLN